ncbi:hypothetical protein [Natrialba sp. SSL1]|uniref:hypothetical protein n=1 Tax=Natrialba sp. SSL1 TaxID=1869245 RepID=UPI0011141132|nr:hypothetical protein [Natrialba sp. SSL1]
MAVNGSSADAVEAGDATDCLGARRAGRIEAGALNALGQRTGEQECDIGADSGRPSGRVSKSNLPGHTSGSREDT